MKKFTAIFNFLFFTFLITPQETLAQSMVYIGDNKIGIKYFISNQKDSIRMGKGVIAWFITEYDDIIIASKYYFSCDGKKMSTLLNAEVIESESRSKRLTDLKFRFINSELIPTKMAEIVEWEYGEIPEKNKTRIRIKDVCSTASKEKKDFLFPYGESIHDPTTNRTTIYALESGTFLRKGEIVEGWDKSYKIKINVKSINGESFSIREIVNEGHTMGRVRVNCKEGKYAIIASYDYDNIGKIKSRTVFRDSEISFESAIPGSRSDAMVSTICSIY